MVTRSIPLNRQQCSAAAMLLLLAGLAAAFWTIVPVDVRAMSPSLSWWALTPLVVAAELMVVHVQVRREAQAISLSEIPMVLALFLSTPGDMLMGVLLGSAIVYIGCRHQAPLKALFNLALRAFGVCATLVTFHLVAGSVPDLSPRAWTAAVLAVSIAGMFDSLVVLAVVGLSEGSFEGHLLREVAGYLPVCAVLGSVGVIATMALHADPRSAVLLLVTGTALIAAHRAYATLHSRHVILARLYDVGRQVGAAPDSVGIVLRVLGGARELLRAEVTELVLVGATPREPQRWALRRDSTDVESGALSRADLEVWDALLRSGEPVILSAGRRRTSQQHLLARLGYREAILVPLRDEQRMIGALLVADRMGEVRTFQPSDLPMLETVATQASLALSKSALLDQLGHDARHDVLTGLANRAHFRSVLLDALEQIGTEGNDGLAVLLLDLNKFKEVNDSLGHHAGDAVLLHVSRQLSGVDTPGATVARLGGDEFAIILPGIADETAARIAAARFQDAVSVPVFVDGVEIVCFASIGIALAPLHSQDVSRLLRQADAAMYVAKSSDRGIESHQERGAPSASSISNTRRPMTLLAELRDAISTGGMDVHFQPQATTRDGAVFGVEALVRWEHPQLGMLAPAAFMPMVNSHGLMRPLTELVLDRSIAEATAWRSAGLQMAVSVNLSARSLVDDRIYRAVEEALSRHGLPPELLTLEITEDSVISDPTTTMALLNRLRMLGVRMAVDDFGTGYSSLAYLQRLPVQEVKIDRSFVSKLTTDLDDQAIVRSIIDLAANLDLEVIAEGVEDQACWDLLSELGCTSVQGYHLARPMPSGDLPGWLTSYNGRSGRPDAIWDPPVHPSGRRA